MCNCPCQESKKDTQQKRYSLKPKIQGIMKNHCRVIRPLKFFGRAPDYDSFLWQNLWGQWHISTIREKEENKTPNCHWQPETKNPNQLAIMSQLFQMLKHFTIFCSQCELHSVHSVQFTYLPQRNPIISKCHHWSWVIKTFPIINCKTNKKCGWRVKKGLFIYLTLW